MVKWKVSRKCNVDVTLTKVPCHGGDVVTLLVVWCLLLFEEVTCFFGWHHCHLAAVSYSFNILIFIPFLRIPFRSIPGPFQFQFQNDSIPPKLGDSGMLNLAEVPAKFNFCGFRWNPQE